MILQNSIQSELLSWIFIAFLVIILGGQFGKAVEWILIKLYELFIGSGRSVTKI